MNKPAHVLVAAIFGAYSTLWSFAGPSRVEDAVFEVVEPTPNPANPPAQHDTVAPGEPNVVEPAEPFAPLEIPPQFKMGPANPQRSTFATDSPMHSTTIPLPPAVLPAAATCGVAIAITIRQHRRR